MVSLSRLILPVLGLAALGGGLASTRGFVRPSSDASNGALRLDSKTEAALETLHQEMQRRFHDRNEVDFGFSRLVRNNVRSHNAPPLMAKNNYPFLSDGKGQANYRVLQATDGSRRSYYEINDPELGWTKLTDLRPQMKAENEREKQAIDALWNAKADVAIYTFGLLGQDGMAPRAKGPGYLRQKTAQAPAAETLLKYARQAWRAGGDHVVVEGPDGWYLVAHRVEADHEACVKCHAHSTSVPGTVQMGPRSIPGQVQKALYRVGDDLGMVVIAVRPR